VTFFYLAILPSSRIFGDSYSAPGLADRILYLPSVGMAILVAVGLSMLARRFGRRIAVLVVVMVAMIFIPLSWARNAEWASDTVLFERDYSRLENKQRILNTLLAAHLREKNFGRMAELCDLHGETQYLSALIGANCGSAYGNVGRYSDAEQAYLNATELSDSRVFAHFNLAMMYTFLGRRTEAKDHFGLAIAAEPSDFMKEYFNALMVIQLHPNERVKLLEARQHLERALQLQPQHTLSRQELDELNARLSQAKRTKPE
jgi:tetratricopeptide (TPR) repeat protein